MLITTNNPKDSRWLEGKSTKPLADETRAGTLDGLGTQQRIHDDPSRLVGSLQHLVHMKPHFIIGPDSTLVGKDFLPSWRAHGLASKSMHQSQVSD